VPDPAARPGLAGPRPDQAERIAVGFAQALRAAGMAVSTGRTLLFAEALGRVGLDRQSAVYWAGRATLLTRAEDRATYERVFAAYWLSLPFAGLPPVSVPVSVALDDAPEPPGQDDGGGEREEPVTAVRYSPAEVLRHRDFARLSDAEWAEARRLIAELQVSAETRRARRLRPAGNRGERLDLRRSVRRSIPAGGELVRLSRRTATRRPRRLLLLVDVSGSMDSYARALLRFAHAAMRARGRLRVSVFAIGTRLTPLTRELSNGDADAAMAAATESVADWSGGTRLGQCLRDFNDRWGARGLARGAVTVVFSDGWDRGEPELLGTEMARLHRLARRVIWVNPLKASPDFAPLARGMAAALPWVDEFIPGHSIAALEHLAAVIAGPGTARRAPAGRPAP
jgi:uncharacterized protein with von Willebrand factor type A (vWA) domain